MKSLGVHDEISEMKYLNLNMSGDLCNPAVNLSTCPMRNLLCIEILLPNTVAKLFQQFIVNHGLVD